MENQERHSKKIGLLAKCLDAGLITLQEALFILDADIVPEKPASPQPVNIGNIGWGTTTHIQPYSYPRTTTDLPLTGTVTGGRTFITSNHPIGTNVTYTSTSSSPGETLTMHANTVGSVADTKQE